MLLVFQVAGRGTKCVVDNEERLVNLAAAKSDKLHVP